MLLIRNEVFIALAALVVFCMVIAYKKGVRSKLFFCVSILMVVGIAAAFVLQEIGKRDALKQARRDLGVSVLAVNFTDHELEFEIDDWSGRAKPTNGNGGRRSGIVCCFPQKKNGVLVRWSYKDNFSLQEGGENSDPQFSQFLGLPLNNDMEKSLYIWFFENGKIAMKYVAGDERVPLQGDGIIKPILYGDSWVKNFDGDTP